ncbi:MULTISPECIES: hypothetical protein [Actinomycetes]|uniref:hypothetical protein n=1 Tax=Actinomycetes TaxID=1760 RepID=UPI000CFC1ECB|nr:MULTISPECIES: hypothetical protein [unclassified Arthrobacter]MCS3492946.1 hypothetical protein [Arthrobacter sp. JUb119]PQZ90602.1 hypothetical protein CQ016_01390 [Arthrobacter sp. MYb222]PRB75817.1 hypothetical protein CQ012_09100 [Arthrobacter sp. MYb214]TDU26000.1 hypothetical protein EDF61_10562 [Arthrobacter sp. JUb115]
MHFDATVVTALVTLIVLAIATVVLVIRYKRTHQAEIRQALVAKARKRGVASPEDLSNHDLVLQIRAAKRQRKQDGQDLKTA